MKTGAGSAQPGALVFPGNRLRAAVRTQRNDVGSGGQGGGHLGGVAGSNDHVVVITGPKTTEDGGCLLRLDQRQISQKGKDVFGGLQSRRDEGDFHIFVVEVPSERGGQAHRSLIHRGRQDSGAGLSNTMRSLRSSSRLNSRTLSAPVRAVAFQSTWRAES